MITGPVQRAEPRARSGSRRRRTRLAGPGLALALALALAGTGRVAAESPEEPAEVAAPAAASAAAPADAGLTGKEIYEKVLDNRFDSYVEEIRMQSGDRGGNVQETVMEVKYRNFRNESDRILSKVIMKYFAPQDVRHLGYLVINKADGSEDQFVYRPSSRRVQRINLRGEAIFGTDFAFEDIIPQELEDATYARKDDEELAGVPVHVVEVTPKDSAQSEYSKFDVYVTRDQFVPLRVLYWDQDGLKLKELNAKRDSITSYEHVQNDAPKRIWIAKEQKIVHLKLESWTELFVTKLDPTVDLKSRHFSERELTSSH
jgi:hypothetical protein